MCMGVSLSRFFGANIYKSTIQYKDGSELRCSLWKKCCGCDMSFKFVEKNVLGAGIILIRMLRISRCGTGYSRQMLIGVFLSDYVRKLVNLELRYVFGLKKHLVKETISYGSSGKKRIKGTLMQIWKFSYMFLFI